MRASHVLVGGVCLVAVAGCNRGAETPKEAARTFLEANLSADEEAARRVVVSPGASRKQVDLALHARFARSRARKRVVEAAVKRFGPAAAAAFPPPRIVAEELAALDSAPVEDRRETAVIGIGREPLVARRVGLAWWKGWKVELEPVRSAADEERLRFVAAVADEAADATIAGIERGEYADAHAAAAALLRHRLERLGSGPTRR